MEVILNKTIDNLGFEGDVVQVKPGYARNFLFPQKMAMPVTTQNMARLQQEKESINARLEREKKEAEALAGKLSGITIQIARRVGEGNRLFGSVTTADIAARLAETGITVERKAILLNDPIKTIGDTKVNIRVGYQMTAVIIVQVLPESAGD